ncbi:MAG: hypothetical protein NTV34_02105, partial [Proteobacteria bacterium]|nr:hypothetical protein [Pseudomonadota bacterium]
ISCMKLLNQTNKIIAEAKPCDSWEPDLTFQKIHFYGSLEVPCKPSSLYVTKKHAEILNLGKNKETSARRLLESAIKICQELNACPQS